MGRGQLQEPEISNCTTTEHWNRLQTAGTSAKMLTLKGVSIASTCTSAARASAMIPYVVRRSRCLLRQKTYGVSSSSFSGFDVR